MPSLNPTPLLLAPTLLILSLPLFTFAIFTSILAFTALLARVFLVYIELAVVITHDYFFSRSPSSTSAATATATTSIAFNSTTALPPGSRIHSRTHSHSSTFRSALSTGSTGSTLSTISTLPQAIYPHPPSTPRKRSHIRPQPSILLTDTHSDLSASTGTITPGTPQVRDYEGVGGWRLPLTVLSSSSSTVTASVAGVTTEQDTGDPQQQGGRSAAAAVAAAAEAKEEEDEQRWTGMNRRLELPAGKERKRRHRRSLTTAADHFLVRMPVAAGYGSQAGWVTSSGWGRGRGRGTGGDRDRDRDSGEGKGDQ